ncbi:DUF305 domain-containing protein [Streptomyces sp. NBC_00024]
MFLLTVLAVFTGTVLKWDQEGYEALIHNLDVAESLGGAGIRFTSEPTGRVPILLRLYSAHMVIIPGPVLLLFVWHALLARRYKISPHPEAAPSHGLRMPRSHRYQEHSSTMNAPCSLPRRTAFAAVAAAAALVLAACGGNDSTGTASTSPGTTTSASVPAGEHNQADVTFAQGMIPHHRQAIAMADMAETRASSSEVKELAAQIKKAQDPEIETMSGWLRAWGEKVPEGMDGMDGMDNGDASSMPGMMNDQQMDDMRGASGKTFDTMFLTMMIKHHEGAVDMAGTEKNQGAYGPAKALADDIITAQTAEIAQMRKMLGPN